MNRTVHKVCAWSGSACLVLMVIGFILVAGFVPTASPEESARTVADRFAEDHDRIIAGMIVCMFAASFLMMYAVSITLHMRRVEGRYPALSMIQFGLGSIFVLEFIYLLFFWLTAAFREDRPADLVQLLNDMAWIPMVGLTSTAVVQVASFGLVILLDRRPAPLFPRWLGYYNLWVALMFTPGTFNVFFKDGPLAWNGIISWYMPLFAFATWLIINPYHLSKAADSMDADPATDAPDTEIAQLRADLEAIRRRLP